MAVDLLEHLQASLGTLYDIERELGGGGMSRVFVANERRLGRKVVVKVLSPELAAGVSAERFEREIHVSASLQQANIVPVLSAGESNGLPYFTMPFVDGESLRQRLADGRTLSLQESVRVLGDVARALAYAHQRGVVHRDIKPDNVLLSGGTAVVTDFGIAKALSAARTRDGKTLTQLGTSIGTPAYMAPEQAAGDPDVDQRADIYAFGCLAYELLAGRPPFHGQSPQRILAAHLSQTPQALAELNPNVPVALTDLVTRCLEKEPNERPQSAAELTAALDSITGGNEAMPAGRPVVWRRALLLYAASFLAVMVAAKTAIVALGLPDWVLPGAVIVMLLGLPVILFTAYAHHATYVALTAAPPRTPGGSVRRPGTLASVAVKASRHATWWRVALGGGVALGVFVVGVAAFMILRALGIGPAGSLISAGKLSRQEPLLVADFQTGTADSALSRVLAEAMRTTLGESRVVSLVQPEVVAGGRRRMLMPPDSLLTASHARDLAQREGIKAVVAGTVAPLSAGYVISARLIAASTGDTLARAQETVDGASDLIAATDRLGRKLRERIGESLKHVRADPPLEQVTTSSLDALRKYAEAVRANDVEDSIPKAIRLLQEAIALDTMFGMAYRKLGIAYNNRGGVSITLRRRTFDKAYQFRDRMTERERLLTTANYHGNSGPHPDRAKAIAAYEAVLQRYPDEPTALLNLGNTYYNRREYARAESLFRRGLESPSPDQFAPFNIVNAQLSQGKVDAARGSLTRAARWFPMHERVATSHELIVYATGEIDSLAGLVSKRLSDPSRGDRRTAVVDLRDIRRRQGRLNDVHSVMARWPATDTGAAGRARALRDSLDSAREEVWFLDRPSELVRRLDADLRLIPLATLPEEGRPYDVVALMYAAAGRTDRARAILAQFDTDVRDTVIRRLSEPQRKQVLASIALAERRYRDAVDLFRAGDRLGDGPVNRCPICVDPLVGHVFDLAPQPDSAIATYEHFVNTPDAFRWSIDGWELARIVRRLGELYEAKGDRAKAAAHYQRFVDMWRDADPALQPRVAEVRQRLARLTDVERR